MKMTSANPASMNSASASAMTDEFVISCTGLQCSAGDHVILDVGQLALKRGGTYLLSGANGAGKTTLLRVLAGLDRARCSAFSFDGRAVDLAKYPAHVRRQIGFVHHHPVLFSTSVQANIAFGLRAAGIGAAQANLRANRAIEWAGIGNLVDRTPRGLSAGEKQRVALARAHALDPGVYLLDEPTANLDDEGRELVTRLIDAIAAEGRTLLIACHDRDLLGLPGVVRWHMTHGRLDPPL